MTTPSASPATARAIFEAVNDALVIFDLEGRPVECNSASQQLFGYPLEEFLQLHTDQLIHPASRPAFATFGEEVRAGRNFYARGQLVRKDGSLFHADVRGQAFIHMGQLHALAIIRDVSEEVAATQLLEQHMAERTRQLAMLAAASQSMISTLELKPLLGLILEQLKQVVEYRLASISALEGDVLVLLGQWGQTGSMVGERENLGDHPNTLKMLAEGKPLIIPDLGADSYLANRVRGNIQKRGQEDVYVGSNSWMSIPLLARNKPVGALILTHAEVNYYTPARAELTMAFANYAAIAIENARLYEQAQHLAALEERQKLARELHDSVSQALYGIVLGARTARTLLDRDPPKAAEPMEYILALAEAGLAEMRALIFELRPESLQTEGLVAALGKLIHALGARHQLKVRLEAGEEPEIPIEVKEALYRIAQEALNNIARHAQAQQVDLSLKMEAGELVLNISDDGLGFDTSQPFPGHLGLHTMRERAEKAGGTFTIASAPGAGTRVQIRIRSMRG